MNLHMSRISISIFVLVSFLFLQGCTRIAFPVLGAASARIVAADIDKTIAVAQKQYPDIDFASTAPVRVTYAENHTKIWITVIDTLQEMGEDILVIDKVSGIINMQERSLKDVGWIARIGKSIGTTFRYRYKIVCRSTWVKVDVSFGVKASESAFLEPYAEEKLPQGANMMRHIFFRDLSQKLKKTAEEFPKEPENKQSP